jgi:hypothetical protein
MTSMLAGANLLLVAGVILELAGRQVARRSLVEALTGLAPGAWTLVALAAALGLATTIVVRRRAAPLLFGLLFAAGLAAQLQLGARLQSDGFYYYAYLRSLAFDRDVEFSNDYRMLGLGDKPHLFEPTPTGYAHSAWTIGPALVWSPFFAAGHLVASRLHAADPNVSADGISFPYRQAVCIAGLFYGLLGCWFCYRLTARLFGRVLAAGATASVMAGSFMLWYMVKEPSMTHAPSMAAVAGFTWAWLATRGQTAWRRWALLGALAGFMTLLRWQNALFAVLPAWEAAAGILAAARTRDRSRATRLVAAGLLFTACAAAAFLPQMLAWKAIYGSWLAVSPVGPQIRWSDPHLADILWSSRNGLLSTSPVLYAAALGLLLVAVRHAGIGVPVLGAIALMTYFNSCIQDWWGSDGFGMRRFDGTIPLFCLGMAASISLARAAVRRFPAAAALVVLGTLSAWNLALMSAAHSGAVRLGEAVLFGDAAGAQVRALHGWFGMPSTYPASLLFALRSGVSPARYDLLSPNRFLADPARQYGRVDLGLDDGALIASGWHAAERDGSTTFRWAEGRASLLVPLDRAAPLRVQVRLRAFAYAGAPGQAVSLVVNDASFGPVPVASDWQVVEWTTPAGAWRGAVNHVSLVFERAARPADVGGGGDTRTLAAAVDYVRVEVPR